jgi:hypothetical protein
MSSISRHWFVCLVVCGFLATVIPPGSYAQVLYGTVIGTVVDSSDAVIRGANVTLTNTETGQTRVTTTNNTGVFTLFCRNH